MSFPERRLRRLRRTPALRRMVAETQVGPDDLIAPLFIREGLDEGVELGEVGVVGEDDHQLAAHVRRVARPDLQRGGLTSA